jgi:biotin operon repressor
VEYVPTQDKNAVPLEEVAKRIDAVSKAVEKAVATLNS